MKNAIKYVAIVICIILSIKFLAYLFSDQPYPGSPYDEWIVLEEPLYVEQPKENNLTSIEEVVKKYAKEWTGSEKLREVGFFTNKEHEIERYLLEYAVDNVKEYPGRIYIYCKYIDNRFVITSAHTLYGEDFNANVEPLTNLKNVEMIYQKTLDYLYDKNFSENYHFKVDISAENVYVNIFDKEGKIVENLKLDIYGNNLVEDN